MAEISDGVGLDKARGAPRWSSRFRNYRHSEPRFRALLTEDGTQQIDLARA
jgi:hypothetical protein